MNCWFDACITDSFGELEPLRDGLGFLRGTACPHYDSEAARRPTLHEALLDGMPSAYAAEDGAALHFVGEDLVMAITNHAEARAYRVEARDGKVVEEPIPTRFLGAAAPAR